MRLRYKLFLIILLANTLLVTSLLVANNRAFNTSFETYLSQVQARRLTPLLDALAEEYRTQGNWQRLQDNEQLWEKMVQDSLFGARPRDSDRQFGSSRRRAHQQFQLRDAEGRTLIDSRRSPERMVWLPLEVESSRPGALGVPVDLRLTNEFDQVFAEQQRRQFLWIALLALLLAGAVAIPFASALARPIARLQRAAHQLALGHYTLSLPEQGRDEVAELARDFNTLARRLQQNLEARQRWIADISHELRTPVSVLQAELEALLDGVSSPNQETLESLHQEIRRLSGLIGDLHELSLSDAGALSYQMSRVDLVELIESVRAHRQSTLQHRGMEWQFIHPEAPVWFHGDPNRLVQLFTNLLENSLSYTDSSEQQPGQIRVELQQRVDSLHLHWSDSTPGVPEASLPRLFDRLYREDPSRNRNGGGSGLGLSIARNIVEAHDGQISAHASPFGGVTMMLSFPLTPRPPESPL